MLQLLPPFWGGENGLVGDIPSGFYLQGDGGRQVVLVIKGPCCGLT